MQYRIEFADDLMMVMDDGNHGHDAHVVSPDGRDEAERKIDEWAGAFKFDVGRAKRAMRNLVRQM
jgi:hypothetical protein